MSTPNMDSAELFNLITAVPKPHKIFDFPRYDAEGKPLARIAMQILSQGESMTCQAEAEKTAKALLKDSSKPGEAPSKGYEDIFNNASAVEVIFRAARNPNDLTKPFFVNKADITRHLTSDELGILLNYYFTVQVELGPVIGSMSQDELNAWVKKLSEGGADARNFLDSFSLVALKELLMCMVYQLSSYKTDTSSPTLQPENMSSLSENSLIHQ